MPVNVMQQQASRSKKAYESALTKALRTAIDDRGTNARELSKRAGCGATAVSDILTGRNKKPSALVLQNIATALLCPVDYFTKCGAQGERQNVVVPLIVEPNIDVIGVAETGAYRRANETTVTIQKIAGPLHRRFPNAKPYALEVRDRSMDRAAPFPLTPGAYACFIEIKELGNQIEPGNLYAIRRRVGLPNGSGSMYETFLRRAVRDGGAAPITLRAESSERGRYPDIVVKGLSADTADDVHVIGLVYAVVAYMGE